MKSKAEKGAKQKKRKPKIKAIIFDVAGVLVGGKIHSDRVIEHSGVHEYMANKLKMDLDSWIDAIETPYNKSMEGQIDGERAVKWISENLHIDQKKLTKIWVSAFNKKLKVNRRLYKIAFKLKRKGYIIGILSDQWYLSKKSLTPEKNLRGFDPVIISCDVGFRKPNPLIYELLIKNLKKMDRSIKPQNIVFIDNRDWNLGVPKNMGINVILFKDNEQFVKDLEELNVHT